ncbi:threonine synthase [Zavarzinia sp. CC-PAN008]|uniref:threonine synthase n=1 Tax=Zavarzinia sp. CC-PAN008 TaxID=3243332 RepID=UPI003F74ABF8
MDYVSTRGLAPRLGFEDVLLTGLARDGGLYVPETWPNISDELHRLAGNTYADLATRVMLPFIGDAMPAEEFAQLVSRGVATFAHAAVAPLVQIGPNDWILELFHGPTLAFKDVALQLLGHLFERTLTARGGRMTVLGATSGDTGSAAIEAMRGRRNIRVVMLHPKGRVSEVQRRQMTTVLDDNIHNVAIEGTFDDCQALVKDLFNDLDFRDAVQLGAVNSINWARLMPQAAYYVYASLLLGGPDRALTFSVPTGNFGDCYAGLIAERLGLHISRLVVATNRNDIVARALTTGFYDKGETEPTMSPSMDIQVSSNFERLLYEVEGRDPAVVRAAMEGLRDQGSFQLGRVALMQARSLFTGRAVSEEETLDTIARVHGETGLVIDPHTAVGIAAARTARMQRDIPVVTLATAHPAKFPDAVERAIGKRPALPDRLADLLERPEHYDVLPADADKLKAHVRSVVGNGG